MISTQVLPIVAVQVNAILEVSSDEIRQRIPENVIRYFREIASKDYYFSYDNSKTLLEQNISKETREILAIIYRDYICNDDEKKEFLEKRKQIDYQNNLKKMEKYSYDNLFSNKERINKKENLEIIERDEPNLLMKIILKIKSFFIGGE